jgi:teichuronic acid biosynthesis glycosyltransferase TuaG
MKDYCYFSTITVIYDREYVGLIQIEPVRKDNDYAMWLRVIEKTPCYRFGECLSYYIKHEGSISSGSKWKLIKHHYILWRVAEHKNPISAWVLTFRNIFWWLIKRVKYKKDIKEVPTNVTLQ